MFVGSSGTFAATMLESAGYYYQQLILDSLAGPLTGSLGALIYIVAIIVAVISVVSTGKYSFGAWLLIGPGLYFSTVVPRTAAIGSEWALGNTPRNTELVQAEVKELLKSQKLSSDSNVAPAQVSYLFAWYNNLASSAIKEIVKGLNNSRDPAQFGFILRQQIFSEIHSANVSDPGFIDLLHSGFFTQCRSAVQKGREVYDERNTHVRDALSKEYTQLMKTNVRLNSRQAKEWLAGFRAAYERKTQIFTAVMSSPVDAQRINDFVTALSLDKGQAGAISVDPKFPDYLPEDYRLVDSSVFTCEQIWQFVRIGLVLQAKRVIDGSTQELKSKGGIEYDNMLSSLGMITGLYQVPALNKNINSSIKPKMIDLLYRSVAMYIMRNEANKDMNSGFLHEFANRTGVRELELPGQDNLVRYTRESLQRDEWEEKTRLITSAAQLPYYQGLVLYFLSVLFPFFALLLLIPGRHAGFLLWFGLWFWAKSWDIGFAVIMLLDDMLFAMFSVAHESGAMSAQPLINTDASAALSLIRELDPSFELGTYYAIMATAVHSIPVIASYLVLGSLQGGAGLIAQGISSYSQGFQNAAGAVSAMRMTQAQASAAEEFGYKNAQQYVQNAKAGKNRLIGASGDLIDREERDTLSGPAVNAVAGSDRGYLMRFGFPGVGRFASADDAIFSSLSARSTAIARGVSSGLKGREADDERIGESLQKRSATRVNSVGKLLFNIDKAADTFARAVDPFAESYLGAILNMHAHEVDLAAVEGYYNGFNEEQFLDYLYTAVRWEMLEIPWNPGHGYFTALADRDLAGYLESMKVGVAGASGLTSVIPVVSAKEEEKPKKNKKPEPTFWDNAVREGGGAGLLLGGLAWLFGDDVSDLVPDWFKELGRDTAQKGFEAAKEHKDDISKEFGDKVPGADKFTNAFEEVKKITDELTDSTDQETINQLIDQYNDYFVNPRSGDNENAQDE